MQIFVDHTQRERRLGRIPCDQKELAGYRRYGDVFGVIPESEWREIEPFEGMNPEFVNNQRNSSGCVGWSAAQAEMRARVRRGEDYAKLSGAFIYAHINGGRDAGASIVASMRVMQNIGTCLESEFNYPNLFKRQIPTAAFETAKRFKLVGGVICRTMEEMASAIQRGHVVQHPIQVSGNFDRFDEDGCAGYGGRGGNHSVHAIGMRKRKDGNGWVFVGANSWGTGWGPWNNGHCCWSWKAVDACMGDGETFVHTDVTIDPLDETKPPSFT